MRLPTPLSRPGHRISLTPLIDIVFILLLFFILESNFLRFGELGFDIPEKEQGGLSSLSAIDIQVFADGQIWLEGRALAPATLDTYLREKHYDVKTPVFIRAQDDLPVQSLVRVVDIFQRHALSRLQILELQE
jgi:biopolymer transport protein ExbD